MAAPGSPSTPDPPSQPRTSSPRQSIPTPTSPLPPANRLAPAFSLSLLGPGATLAADSFSVFLGLASTFPAGLPSASGS